MFGWKSRSWFYPKPTGDPGRDRNARTVQFACFLLAFAVSAVAILNVISGEPSAETPILVFAVAGLVAAMIMNCAGRWEWAARTAFLAVLLTAMLLVFEAHDGFRSLAMLVFPGMLLLSVMLLDRASYMITAGIVLVAVAALGIAERQGLTRAIPRVRSSTTYESIFGSAQELVRPGRFAEFRLNYQFAHRQRVHSDSGLAGLSGLPTPD